MKTILLRFRKSQSLMEVVIGIGVIGIVFTGVAGLVSVSLQSAQFTREKSIAQSLIHDMAAAVKGIVRSDWHDLWSSIGGVSYWSLDEGPSASGNNTIVLDQIEGNNGRLVVGSGGSNAVVANAWKSGSDCKSGSCIAFDGTDDYVRIEDADNLDGTSQMSVFLWAKRNSLTDFEKPIGKFYGVAVPTGSWLMYEGGPNNQLVCTFNINGTWSYAPGTYESLGSTGVWYHLGCVYDGTYVKTYVNGTEVGTFTAPGMIATSTYPVAIGAATDGTNVQGNFNGTIDDVRLYNRALSPTEVAALYGGINKLYPTRYTSTWQIKEGQETQTISNIPFIRSFALEPVMRDGSNNIIASGGTDDALTKRVTYTVGWKGRTFSDYEYIFRSTDSVFTQTDWSTGQVSTTTTFTAPTGFLTASSSVVYASAGLLSNQLGSSATSSMSSTYRYGWSDVAKWIDFYPLSYDSGSTKFGGLATSSLGEISTSCLDLGACASSNYQVYMASTTGATYTNGDFYGYGWSDEIGWLSFNCNQTGVGGPNTCATVSYKVYQATSTGDLYGYAWNDVIGWISVNCADLSICGTSSYKVKMNPSTGGSVAATLESLIFDTQAERGVVPVALVWQGTLTGDTQVRFQIASSNSESGPWVFVGNDGTSSSYYPGAGSAQPDTSIPISKEYHFNHRYLRYKIYLVSSATDTPSVEDISLIWKQ